MKKSNNNTRGRGRGGVQHVLPSNIFTTQSSNSNTSVFNESQHSFKIQNLPNIQAIHSLPDPKQQNIPKEQPKHKNYHF
ncbi:unnamed protein product [Rhizophagus irregularis]|nr:unnamed protein product [Rhizophagus irregularis]